MTLSETEKQKLAYFVEKSDRFLSLVAVDPDRFPRLDSLVEFNRETGWDAVFDGPDEDHIDAVLLTLRFFVVDNESTSLRNMASLLDQADLGGSHRSFQSIRDGLNQFLDQAANLSIEEGRQLTYRDVMELFLWGGRAHGNNPQRVEAYSNLSQTPFFPILQTDFIRVLWAFRAALQQLRSIVSDVLEELETSASA